MAWLVVLLGLCLSDISCCGSHLTWWGALVAGLAQTPAVSKSRPTSAPTSQPLRVRREHPPPRVREVHREVARDVYREPPRDVSRKVSRDPPSTCQHLSHNRGPVSSDRRSVGRRYDRGRFVCLQIYT